MYPKVILLAPFRRGRRFSNKFGSLANQVLERIRRWSFDRDALWEEVKGRAAGRGLSEHRDGLELRPGSGPEATAESADGELKSRVVPELSEEKAPFGGDRACRTTISEYAPIPGWLENRICSRNGDLSEK